MDEPCGLEWDVFKEILAAGVHAEKLTAQAMQSRLAAVKIIPFAGELELALQVQFLESYRCITRWEMRIQTGPDPLGDTDYRQESDAHMKKRKEMSRQWSKLDFFSRRFTTKDFHPIAF